MIADSLAPQLTGSADSSLIRRRERSGERMRRQCRMEEGEDEEEGEKG